MSKFGKNWKCGANRLIFYLIVWIANCLGCVMVAVHVSYLTFDAIKLLEELIVGKIYAVRDVFCDIPQAIKVIFIEQMVACGVFRLL
ncbi:MAG: hypothetical protein LBE13_10735 [Bacteroidales bacterium]|nr:hypothetical protein [Bacteroidales bacterium]